MYKTQWTLLMSSVMSIVTCVMLVATFGGCTTEQLAQTDAIAKQVEVAVPIIVPAVGAAASIVTGGIAGFTWPIWSVLIADIISSIAAVVVAARKQIETNKVTKVE